MDLALSPEQQQLVTSFANLLAKSSSTEQVRAAESTGHDPALWSTLCETGAIAMAVPEARGGWSASLVDLVLVGEQLGRALASSPVVESQVTARLLAAIDDDLARDAVAGMVDDGRIITLSVRPAPGNCAPLTPAGAVCGAVVVYDGSELRLIDVDDTHRRTVSNVAAAPLADLDVVDGATLASNERAREMFEDAIDDWLTLTAAVLVGVGARALELGCAYATERHAFGSPIGAFQGIAHPLADDATNLDGARLLVQKAAWARDRGDRRARELAAMAFAFTSTTVEQATYDALHFHGGYGFMLEHDVQLFYRRARGWPRVWGDASTAYRRAANVRYGHSEDR